MTRPWPLAVELDGHVALGGLGPVGQQALRHHHLAAGLAVELGVPQGGVDAPIWMVSICMVEFSPI